MENDDLERVGVIGLGIIGSRVAERLRATDRNVYVWSRTPKPVPNFVASPGEMARVTDVIQVFVGNGEALVETVRALRGDLTSRHVVLNHTTSDPESVVEAYQITRDAGAAFLDAPFTGSREAAEKGALVYYIGGDPDVLETVRPVLEVSSRDQLYLGRVGEATVLKLATNMIAAASVQVLSEAYGLVTAAGIDPERLREALANHGANSPLLTGKLSTILSGDFEPHFTLKNMFKDSQYALALSKSLGIELPALSATASLLFRTMQRGHSEEDFSVVAARYQDNKAAESRKEAES